MTSAEAQTESILVASTNNVQVVLHYLGGTGPVALFAHATGFHGRVWEPVAKRLHGWQSFAPDLRGHGDSVIPDDLDFAWSGFADDVLACIDALDEVGVDTSRLLGVGHSKGGAALLLAEQRRPGTFSALWCYEPVTFPPEVFEMPEASGSNPLAAGARARRPHFPSYEAAYDNFAAKPPMSSFDPASLRAYVEGGFRQLEDGSVTLKCLPDNEAQVYEMAHSSHAFDHLSEVGCPTVVVRGHDVGFGPSSIAERVSEALPIGCLEVHDDLGHFGPLEAPARMAESIRRLADEAVSPRA